MGTRRSRLTPLALLPPLVCGGCAGGEPSFAPPLEIPVFAADDPRPNEPGFISQVRLAETELRLVGFTLMAFQVGDTLTLGAMTKRPFDGNAVWRLGDHRMEIDFAGTKGEQSVPVQLDGPRAEGPNGTELTGQQASVRDFRWINIELPAATWLDREPIPLSLTFEFANGASVSLPAAGHYEARRSYP